MATPTARSVLALCLALVLTLSGAQAGEPAPTSWMTTPTPREPSKDSAKLPVPEGLFPGDPKK